MVALQLVLACRSEQTFVHLPEVQKQKGCSGVPAALCLQAQRQKHNGTAQNWKQFYALRTQKQKHHGAAQKWGQLYTWRHGSWRACGC